MGLRARDPFPVRVQDWTKIWSFKDNTMMASLSIHGPMAKGVVNGTAVRKGFGEWDVVECTVNVHGRTHKMPVHT